MTTDARAPAHGERTREDGTGPARPQGHPRLVLAVLTAVVVLDQATKSWAWRTLPGALINPGGNKLVGRQVGTWYSAQLSGAVLDVQSAVVLGLSVWLLVGVPRRLFVVPAAMAVAGWSSNALDRLGLHFWTAPGSARGAVDFIPIHGCIYNVADFFIVGGTAFLVVALAYGLRRGVGTGRPTGRRAGRPGKHIRRGPAVHRPRRGPLAALGLATAAGGLVGAVAFGAVHDDGLTKPQADHSTAASLR